MLPIILVVIGGGLIAFGASYFPALEAEKGAPFVGVGLLAALVGMVISDGPYIFLLMVVLLPLALALSFPIYDFRTRRNKKH